MSILYSTLVIQIDISIAEMLGKQEEIQPNYRSANTPSSTSRKVLCWSGNEKGVKEKTT